MDDGDHHRHSRNHLCVRIRGITGDAAALVVSMRNDRRDLKETFQRLRNPSLVYSHLANAALATLSPIVPSRFNELFGTVRPYTMVQYRALRALYFAVWRVVNNGVSGDVVECGVAHGGSAALLGLTIKETEQRRRLWLFDTFSGIPAPTSEDPDYDIAAKYTGDFAPHEDVRATLTNMGVSDFTTIQGLFEETVSRSEVESIAVLHIDGDWYSSVKACLEGFYDRVTPGGLIQFDDYGYWAGARKAVDEFFAARKISPTLVRIDFSTRQFIKP